VEEPVLEGTGEGSPVFIDSEKMSEKFDQYAADSYISRGLDLLGILKFGGSKLSLIAFSRTLTCSRIWVKRSSSPKEETRDSEWYSAELSEIVLLRPSELLSDVASGYGREAFCSPDRLRATAEGKTGWPSFCVEFEEKKDDDVKFGILTESNALDSLLRAFSPIEAAR